MLPKWAEMLTFVFDKSKSIGPFSRPSLYGIPSE